MPPSSSVHRKESRECVNGTSWRTYLEPEHLGSMRTGGAVLPRQVLVDASALLRVSWVPVVWSLELLCQILQDGDAALEKAHMNTAFSADTSASERIKHCYLSPIQKLPSRRAGTFLIKLIFPNSSPYCSAETNTQMGQGSSRSSKPQCVFVRELRLKDRAIS